MHEILNNAAGVGVNLIITAFVGVLVAAFGKLFVSGKVDVEAAKTAAREAAERQAELLMKRAVLAVEEKFAADGTSPAPRTKRATAFDLFEAQGGTMNAGTDTLLHAIVSELPGIGARDRAID